jgi:hypothetical protein
MLSHPIKCLGSGVPASDLSAPYFDFLYTCKEPPQETLSALLGKDPQCSVIDWSPGRSACTEAHETDVEALAEIIRDLAEAVCDEHITFVDASYEEWVKRDLPKRVRNAVLRHNISPNAKRWTHNAYCASYPFRRNPQA